MARSRVKLGAVFVGWVISCFMLLVMLVGTVSLALYAGFDIAQLINGEQVIGGFYLNFALFISAFTAFFAGGYVSGRMAAVGGSINGVLVVVTSALTLFFAGTFTVIVGNALSIDVMGSIEAVTGAYRPLLMIAGVFALAGSVFGGRFGEGYIVRLDTALTLTARAQNSRQSRKTTIPESAPAAKSIPVTTPEDPRREELGRPRRAG
ncbi:MAG: hypothetical protein KGZ93_07770 [Actinobacteria bacterium]|nr:hypothetical protein [Actinomycetota bacterium]